MILMIFTHFALLCLVVKVTWYHAISLILILFVIHAMLFILITCQEFVSDSTLGTVGNEFLAPNRTLRRFERICQLYESGQLMMWCRASEASEFAILHLLTFGFILGKLSFALVNTWPLFLQALLWVVTKHTFTVNVLTLMEMRFFLLSSLWCQVMILFMLLFFINVSHKLPPWIPRGSTRVVTSREYYEHLFCSLCDCVVYNLPYFHYIFSALSFFFHTIFSSHHFECKSKSGLPSSMTSLFICVIL